MRSRARVQAQGRPRRNYNMRPNSLIRNMSVYYKVLWQGRGDKRTVDVAAWPRNPSIVVSYLSEA